MSGGLGAIKPWQIVVLVAAVVAVAASLYLTLARDDSIPLASQMTVVDVTTGDLYSIPISGHKMITLPATNPATGKVSLFPAEKNQTGQWVISPRYLGGLSQVEGDPKALLDRKSGAVKVTSETPKRL
jgi:hypothetical protein